MVYNKKKLDHPKRDKQNEKYITDPVFSSYEYPMSLKDMKTFEKRSFNKFEGYTSMSINVYTFEADRNINPCRFLIFMMQN